MIDLAGSLDTNILLRWLLKDVPQHYQQAIHLLNDTPGQLVVADTAIIEMVFVLESYYELSRPQIAEAVQAVMIVNTINCNRPLFTRVLPIYVKHPSLSFADCCLAVYAELNEAEPLWTFDKKLAKQFTNTKLLA